MADFLPAFERLIAIEGGFSPQDAKAGAVNWGITQATLRRLGLPHTLHDVQSLTIDRAHSIYLPHYWDKFSLGQILDQNLAEVLFIHIVNAGSLPVRFLQQSLNDLGADPPLKIDHALGPLTLAATNRASSPAVIRAVGRKMLTHYFRLAKDDPDTYKKCLSGWIERLRKLDPSDLQLQLALVEHPTERTSTS